MPVLSDHLERISCPVDLFSLRWFQTLFIALPGIPERTVTRLWDCWILEDSFDAFHKFGLALLKACQATLLNMDMEEVRKRERGNRL